MRKISLIAFAGLLLLWGLYYNLKGSRSNPYLKKASETELVKNSSEDSILSKNRRRELDKIGAVVNEQNVALDDSTKEYIKEAKNKFDYKQGIKDLQALLEQSYLDRNSTIKDIKRLQEKIQERENQLKLPPENTEKWDPKFVYYLMIQENYTYAEINTIKSLAENGLTMEEIEYINELIKEEAFLEKIMAFKNQGDISRTVASFNKTKKPKEVDDFIDDPMNDGASIESKLIEMDYNQEEKEEMIYGNNQQK